MKKILIVFVFMGLILLVGCQTAKYDEVIYDCGSRLVKGTEINTPEWDLENGVEVYYLYNDTYSIQYNYPMREWFEGYNAVKLNENCKEILRFKGYTVISPKSN